MDLYLHHGRLNPNEGATDIEGNPVEGEWGFTGPRLQGVTGLHVTYGEMHVFFESVEACRVARDRTGWSEWEEKVLVLPIEDDCARSFNPARNRNEFFGDWGLI